MSRKRNFLFPVITFSLILLTSASAYCQDNKTVAIEEIVSAGNKAIVEGDWASAESQFREAVRLEPKQPLWHIQLLISLGQQKKWKEAFREMDKVVLALGAADWPLTINQKLPDGQVAFINTETFGDEKQGISRYVRAVKEQKKVESVEEDIGKKLDDFAKVNKLALIYDISKFKSKPFESGKTMDVTKEFIAYYNGRAKD